MQFKNEQGTYDYAPPAMRISGRVGLGETIFAEAFTFVRDHAHADQTPKLDDPVAEHGPLSRRQRGDRSRRLPGHRRVLGGSRARLQAGDQRRLRAGLPLPAARRHEPRVRQRSCAAQAHRGDRRRPRASARALHRCDQPRARRQARGPGRSPRICVAATTSRCGRPKAATTSSPSPCSAARRRRLLPRVRRRALRHVRAVALPAKGQASA